MKHAIIATTWLASAPLILLAGNAVGGDGVALSITNDGTDDIEVTVYDTTLGPKAVVLSHERINGFTSIPLSVAADDTGHGNISWSAVTADKTDRKCGHADSVGLGDSATVSVHADSSCNSVTAGAT